MNSRLQNRIDFVALAYLLLPLGVFFAATFRPVAAILLLAVLGIAAIPALRWCWKTPSENVISTKAAIPLLVIALGWTVLAGAGHIVAANPDWYKHDGVLEDLQHYAWPVTYALVGGEELILRYYAGFHTVPALLASVFGALNAWTFIWQALGTVLVLFMLLRRLSTSGRQLLAAVVFIFFGGLDFFGYWRAYGLDEFSLVQYLDAWGIAQYNSTATLLAWVPNHALAAWLGLLLIKDRSHDPKFLPVIPVMLVAVSFWSIFAAIGLLPFAAWPLLRRIWNTRGSYILRPEVIGALALAGLMAVFLLAGAGGGNRHGFLWEIFPEKPVVREAFIFIGLTVVPVVVALLLTKVRFEAWTWLAVVLLFLYPFYVVGSGNSDFTMRASIPAQLVLFLQVCKVIDTKRRPTVSPFAVVWRRLSLGLLAVVLLLGSGAAFTTLARPFHPDVVLPEFDQTAPSKLISIIGHKEGPPDSQYFATQPTWMSALLRHPEPVFEYGEVANSTTPWRVHSKSDSGTKATVVQEGQGIDFSTDRAGTVTFVTEDPLPPGSYRVRAEIWVDPERPAGFTVPVLLDQSQNVVKPGDAPDTYILDDFVIVNDRATPFGVRLMNAGEAGAHAEFRNFVIERVERRTN